jgi:hypothetical protein
VKGHRGDGKDPGEICVFERTDRLRRFNSLLQLCAINETYFNFSSASPRGSRMGGMHADRTSRRSGSRGRRSRSRGRRSRSHGRRSRGRRSRSSSYGSDEYPDYRRRLQEQERMQRESKMERENLERARRLAEEKQERKMKVNILTTHSSFFGNASLLSIRIT